MKHLRIILTLFCLTCVFSGVVNADINDRLVVYCPLNGGPDDLSEYGHKVTVSGAFLTEDRFGNPDSAYSFNGVSDYIEVGNDNSFFINQWNFSVTAWIKSNNPDVGRQIIIEKDLDTNSGFMLELNSGYDPPAAG